MLIGSCFLINMLENFDKAESQIVGLRYFNVFGRMVQKVKWRP